MPRLCVCVFLECSDHSLIVLLLLAVKASAIFIWTAPRKYRLHSMASLVAASVHVSTMSKLSKEMYPSLRQLYGWDNPLPSITTGKTGTAWHTWSLVTGEVSHLLPDIPDHLSQGRYLIYCLTYLITCHRGGISFTAWHTWSLVTGEVSHLLPDIPDHLSQGRYSLPDIPYHLSQGRYLHCLTHLVTCHRGGISFTFA